VIELVDSALTGRAVVFGSLPPVARDLDLLVRGADVEGLAERLAAEGFVRRRREWARFRECAVEVADVVDARGWWSLPADEVDALFNDGVPLEGTRHLVRPAPHHALLILARIEAGGQGRLSDKRRARVDRAVAEDPHAWERAIELAPRWRLASALARLRAVHATGARPFAGRVREARAKVTARRRGRVVSLSGVDGSGKSSQAYALREALETLGYEATVEWTRLSYNPSLDLVAYPIKALLRTVQRLRGRPVPTADPSADPGKALRRRSGVVAHGWAAVVALANASSQRRATTRHLRHGRVVICDRYTLDSTVHLRYRYGAARRFRFQANLIRALSPQPLRSFFLDVPPSIALKRKAEQYDLEQLSLQGRLYHEEHARIGARLLDGQRPREELCAEIACEVWLALP
jgi:thymidylate kinase